MKDFHKTLGNVVFECMFRNGLWQAVWHIQSLVPLQFYWTYLTQEPE